MITQDFRIETDQLKLQFEQGKGERFLINRNKNNITILYPPQTDFEPIQEWLMKVIIEILRKQAKTVLPQRLQELAPIHGFNFSGVRINSARARWGSCSSKKHINLSLFLLILPQELSDYVLLHELCHTVEMNHGKRFWALMDKVTNHRSGQLRNALRRYPSPFRQ